MSLWALFKSKNRSLALVCGVKVSNVLFIKGQFYKGFGLFRNLQQMWTPVIGEFVEM